jgi:type VI secretion system protein ImpA
VRDMLEEMLAAVSRYAPPETDQPSASAEAPQETGAATDAAPGAAAATAGKTPTRDDMLRDLGRIADFFRRTEPHSPLAYTLDEAVRRGRMSWPELLAEIVPDETARNQMLVQLGIKAVWQ